MGEEKLEQKSKENNVLMGVLCYLGILVLIPLLTDAKNEAFVKFHIKQGIVLLITGVVAGFVAGIIPVIGWFLLAPLVSLATLILMIMGIINVVNGKEVELPVIGKYGEKINV
jgi:uncharacterized membrane protein